MVYKFKKYKLFCYLYLIVVNIYKLYLFVKMKYI